MQNESEPCRVESVGESLEIRFFDQGNRYYGDYHRIKIVARVEIPLLEDYFLEEADPERTYRRACRWLGDSVSFVKQLERMGVAGADVDKVKSEMIDQFMDSAGQYLSHPEFPRRFVLQQLQERQSRPSTAPGS